MHCIEAQILWCDIQILNVILPLFLVTVLPYMDCSLIAYSQAGLFKHFRVLPEVAEEQRACPAH